MQLQQARCGCQVRAYLGPTVGLCSEEVEVGGSKQAGAQTAAVQKTASGRGQPGKAVCGRMASIALNSSLTSLRMLELSYNDRSEFDHGPRCTRLCTEVCMELEVA